MGGHDIRADSTEEVITGEKAGATEVADDIILLVIVTGGG